MSIGRIALYGVGGVVVVAVVAVLATFLYATNKNWSLVVEREVERATGRAFEAGAVGLQWRWPPTVVGRNLRLANPDWASREIMLTVPRAEAVIDPTALLVGKLGLAAVNLEGTDLALERNKQGAANWQFAGTGKGTPGTGVPAVDEVVMRDARLVFRDRRRDMVRETSVERLSASFGQGEQAITVSAEGDLDGKPLALEVEGAPLERLGKDDGPYPVRIAAEHGDGRLLFDGTVTAPLALRAADGRLEVETPSLAATAKPFGFTLPEAPFQVTGRLGKSDGRWTLTEMQGALAETAFNGSAALALAEGAEKPNRIDLDVTVPELDLNRLALGGREDDEQAADGRVIPATELAFPSPGANDISAVIKVTELLHETAPLGGLITELAWNSDHLGVERFDLALAGGRVTGTGSAARFGEGIEAAVDLELQRLAAGILIDSFDLQAAGLTGRFGGSLDLSGSARTLRDYVGNMDGRVSLLMDEGSIEAEFVRRAEADLFKLLLAGDAGAAARIACFIVDAPLQDGVAKLETVALKTENQLLVGEGSVDFAAETIDLTIEGGGEGGFFSVEAPVHVTGSFADLEARAGTASLLARTGLTALLGVLAAPAAALAPLVEIGLGEESGCKTLIRQAEAGAED